MPIEFQSGDWTLVSRLKRIKPAVALLGLRFPLCKCSDEVLCGLAREISGSGDERGLNT